MRRFVAWALLASVLCVFGGAITARAQCETCSGIWETEPPFEQFQTLFNPHTVGLPVGTVAPPIEGVELGEGCTLVLAIHTTYDPDYLPLVAAWAAMPDLKVVIFAASLSATDLHDLRQTVGDDASALITDPQATIQCATYHVGPRPSPVTFLVDRTGTIVYRRRGFPLYAALELDRIVRAFAASGRIPADALIQHVSWYGDTVSWPDFPLHTVSREPVALSPGHPRLFYFGPASGVNAVAFAQLDALRTEYPEVEFVWLLACNTNDSVRAVYDYAHAYGIAEAHPEIYDVSFEEFFFHYDRNPVFARLAEEARPAAEDGWTVLFDLDNLLVAHWNLYVSRSVLILDSDGTVWFPCTLFPLNLASGSPVPHPQAASEFAKTLDEMLGQ